MRTIIVIQSIIIMVLVALLTATVEYDNILLEPVNLNGIWVYPT
jgi:hypothetical protein